VEANTSDKPVPREITALLSGERVILRETQRAVTPFGGVAVFITYLQKIGLVEQVRRHLSVRWTSPNHIEPTATWLAFLMTVLVGAKRFAHAGLLRGDQALHALLGMKRFPPTTRSAICSGSLARARSSVFFRPMTEWQMQRLPLRPEGYTLDMDSTVFERYGKQEGSLKGAQPAPPRAAQSSSATGGALGKPTSFRLAPQRQLRNRTWGGGISQRSSRAVGTARRSAC
jgi:hypothetical protein